MLIGAWKNFTELEESLTLDELFELYEGLIESEHESFRREAGLQGVKVPAWEEQVEEEESKPRPAESLKERVARRRAEESGENPDEAAAKTKFGQGVGYRLVGG